MRLKSDEISAIKDAAADVFGSSAVVRLFGSQLNDRKRGGDVDLHIEVDQKIPDYRQQSRFLDRLEALTGGRKIDLVFSLRGVQPAGFERIVYREGKIL